MWSYNNSEQLLSQVKQLYENNGRSGIQNILVFPEKIQTLVQVFQGTCMIREYNTILKVFYLVLLILALQRAMSIFVVNLPRVTIQRYLQPFPRFSLDFLLSLLVVSPVPSTHCLYLLRSKIEAEQSEYTVRKGHFKKYPVDQKVSSHQLFSKPGRIFAVIKSIHEKHQSSLVTEDLCSSLNQYIIGCMKQAREIPFTFFNTSGLCWTKRPRLCSWLQR